jgi:hypothetical protein
VPSSSPPNITTIMHTQHMYIIPCVYSYIYIYICLYLYVYIYIYTYIFIYVCMSVCMYVCMHTCTTHFHLCRHHSIARVFAKCNGTKDRYPGMVSTCIYIYMCVCVCV